MKVSIEVCGYEDLSNDNSLTMLDVETAETVSIHLNFAGMFSAEVGRRCTTTVSHTIVVSSGSTTAAGPDITQHVSLDELGVVIKTDIALPISFSIMGTNIDGFNHWSNYDVDFASCENQTISVA